MAILYIPVESQSRELASRTAVALYSLDNGFSEVILGRDVEVFHNINKAGVVLLKSAASFESELVDNLISNGSKVYSLDEEGILPPLNDASINSRFSEDLLNKLSGVFVNGKLELASFPQWVKTSSKLQITGNPRFDFYAPRKRDFYKSNIKKINQVVNGKKIILIVSRFGDVNLTKDVDYFELLENNGFMNSSDARRFHKGFYNHSKKVFDKFIELPNVLAREFPDCLIVIRPHPSECHEAWQSFGKLDNVIISSEFDIASWLSCSKVMIHNGCTTSVEATAMGVPVISYVPEKSDEYDLAPANELGEIASALKDVIKIIHRNTEPKVIENNLEKLNEIIKYNPNIDASKDISGHLYAGAKSIKDDEPPQKGVSISFILKESIKLFLSLSKVRSCYARKKFPFISNTKFTETVDNVSECLGLGGYKVKRIGVDAFRITKNSN